MQLLELFGLFFLKVSTTAEIQVSSDGRCFIFPSKFWGKELILADTYTAPTAAITPSLLLKLTRFLIDDILSFVTQKLISTFPTFLKIVYSMVLCAHIRKPLLLRRSALCVQVRTHFCPKLATTDSTRGRLAPSPYTSIITRFTLSYAILNAGFEVYWVAVAN